MSLARKNRSLNTASASADRNQTETPSVSVSRTRVRSACCENGMLGTNTSRLLALDTQGSQLLVQVGSLDAERLGGARDVPLVLGELEPDEVELDFFAEL